MKKLLAIIALGASVASYAQVEVVKEAERAMKNGSETEEVVTIITPAFTDPATAELAQTWFIPGKAAFNDYDKLLGYKQLGRLPENGEVKMGKLLVDGYNYFVKALPFDSVPDAKGKVKPKYSKDIVNVLAGHYADYTNAGAELFNARDYQGAYDAWDIFVNLSSMPALNGKIMQFADTIIGEIAYNQALAAWQLNNYDASLDAFMKAKSKGYHKKQLYDYAIAVATQAKKNDTILALAQEALPLYGADDDMYLSQIINYYLQARDFDKAFSIINEAITERPDNAQFFVIRGVLFENNEQKEKASEDYAKAIELDPNNAKALWNYGRMLCDQAYSAADNAPSIEAEYIPYAEENIYPVFRNAAEVLERAYSIDQDNPDNSDILNYLENIYYNLRDEQKLNDVKQRKAYN